MSVTSEAMSSAACKGWCPCLALVSSYFKMG